MIDPHTLLTDLSKSARRESVPAVDVRMRVMESLSVQSQIPRPDLTSVVCCGLAIALSACVVIAMFPTWQTLSEPWVCYLPQ